VKKPLERGESAERKVEEGRPKKRAGKRRRKKLAGNSKEGEWLC